MLRTLARRIPRGRYRLAAAAPSRGQFVSSLATDLGGARFCCDLSEELAREVCVTGVYEPPVSRVIVSMLREGARMVDAGANWGYFSLLAAAAVGSAGQVLALEPDPRQFARLRENLKLNQFTQVVPLERAAADRRGPVTLLGYEDTDSNRGVSRIGGAPDGSGSRAFTVESVAIDDLVSADRAVDLVKIDVEGAEDLVLEGMRAGLSGHRYLAIVLELHPGLLRAKGCEPERLIQTLVGHGYRGWTIDLTPAAYRGAINPRVPIDALLLPIEKWSSMTWPHLFWRC